MGIIKGNFKFLKSWSDNESREKRRKRQIRQMNSIIIPNARKRGK